MPKKIKAKKRLEAIHDYIKSGESLKSVSLRHGMSSETLRRFLKERSNPGKETKVNLVIKNSPPLKDNRRVQKNLENNNKRWKKIEDETLIDAVIGGMSVQETSELLGRTSFSIYTRKHRLISMNKLNERFVFPKGVKRVHKKVKNESIQETPETNPVNVEPTINEVPKIEVDNISNISLEILAGLIGKYGIEISLNISKEATLVQMKKK